MKKQTVRNITEAHGWLGIIFSVVLFIIFWAGSVSFFYPELKSWAELPQYPVIQQDQMLSADKVIDKKLSEYDVDIQRRINFFYPSEISPYYKLGLPIKTGEKTVKYVVFLIDPYTGETLTTSEQFHFASFIMEMHFNLQLPQGTYIVGVITLFLLVLLITGLVIQLKKLIANFFLYRHDKTKRYQYLDLHNVIGVISLPYTILFALTGLMLNLSVIFQAASVMLLYQGDQSQLIKDVGYSSPSAEFLDKKHPMPDLEALRQETNLAYNVNVFSFQFFNYGDENAVIRLRAKEADRFVDRRELYYSVKDAAFTPEINPPYPNTFKQGTRFLYMLHFAFFGDISVRILYFMLGIAVCGMIVVGNLLWLEKRAKNDGRYTRTNYLLQATTLGGCTGIVAATCAGFMLERLLPGSFSLRSTFIESSFMIIFVGFIVYGFFAKKPRQLIKGTTGFCALSLSTLVLVDVLLYGKTITTLWQSGYPVAGGGTIGFLLSAAAFYGLNKKMSSHIDANNEYCDVLLEPPKSTNSDPTS